MYVYIMYDLLLITLFVSPHVTLVACCETESE